MQVIAHRAAAAVPNPVLQHLQAGQITPLAKPTGGHRPLLMMSFLLRLALKSVMAAKKESVAKCAGPLQYGVGRPDGANTMIKTIQYLAEADNSRVLPKCVSQSNAVQYRANRCGSCSCLLQVVHRHHGAQNAQRFCLHQNQCQQRGGSGLSSVSVWILSFVDPVLRSVMAQLCAHYDPGAKLFAYLDDTSHQISQPCSTFYQDTSMGRLLSGPHST